MPRHGDVISQMMVSERYYMVDNDINYLKEKPKSQEEAQRKGDTFNPMHQADNRIAYSFYPLLVDQKTAYMFTAPPIFDVKNDALNDAILEDLGDAYEKKCKDLCVKATNGGIAWVHYWIDEDKNFQWATIPATQIVPVWNNHINTKLEGVFRVYEDTNEAGENITVYEFWNDKEVQAFSIRSGDVVDQLQPYLAFAMIDPTGAMVEVDTMPHDMGAVPFIPFANNATYTPDLNRIKKLIDVWNRGKTL